MNDRNDGHTKPFASVDTKTRNLDLADAAALPPGADHYRAYVGPPDRYDFISATQFALLFHLGVRENHCVLDFGCGSLRLGRLLVPFLLPGCYFGIDPNAWLIEDALKREVGREILEIKSPSFSHNDNFDCGVFEKKFDFIVAQSIISHTGPDFAKRFFTSVSDTLRKDGILLFTYVKNESNEFELPDNGWHYPGCVGYSEAQMMKMLNDAGLVGKPLPWHHPAQAWFVAGKTGDALPADDELQHLTGAVLRSDQISSRTV
jgi:SAM-dependent methyltransferase